MKKKVTNFVGSCFMFVSIGYIVFQIWKSRYELVEYINTKVFISILVGILIYSLCVMLNPILYSVWLSIVCGRKIKYREIAVPYLRSNLYKYLPGNVMHYIGRNQLALITDMTHAEVATATVFEVLITIIAAFIGGILFSSKYVLKVALTMVSLKLMAAILIIVLVCIIIFFLLYKKFSEKINTYLKIIIRKENLSKVGIIFICNLFTMIITALVFVVILASTGVKISREEYIPILGISIIAWLLGFITPGAPGGLGVREALLSVFLSGMVGMSVLSATALIYRVTSILGDIVAFIVTDIFIKNRRKE